MSAFHNETHALAIHNLLFIFSEEEYLRDQAKNLETMEELKPTLDSEHLKGKDHILSDCPLLFKITAKPGYNEVTGT